MSVFGLAAIVGLARLNPAAVSIYEAAKQLQAFAASHPGRYAMGDRSGTPGYLIGQPLLQLEGITADKPFLQRITRRQDLMEAPRDLGVDYYVATAPRKDGDCFVVREPAEAGPQSPVMSGRLCIRPEFSFNIQGITTVVFDLRCRKNQQPASLPERVTDGGPTGGRSCPAKGP